MPRQVEAETAMHIGNADPRPEMWSNQDPVTLFGALVSRSGCEDLRDTFAWLVASRCSNCSAYDVGLVTAGAIGQRPREPAEAAGPPLWSTAQTVLGRLLSQVLMPVLGPLVDLFLLYLIFVGDVLQALQLTALALAFDFLACGVTLRHDGESMAAVRSSRPLRLAWRPFQLWAGLASLLCGVVADRMLWRRLTRHNSVRLHPPAQHLPTFVSA